MRSFGVAVRGALFVEGVAEAPGLEGVRLKELIPLGDEAVFFVQGGTGGGELLGCRLEFALELGD